MQKEKSLYPLNFSLPCNDSPRSTVCSMGKGVEILSGGRGEESRQNAGFGTAKLCVLQILTELSQKIRCASIESARLACIIGMLGTHCPQRGRNCCAGRCCRETVGEDGKIQCQKTIYGAGCSHHGADARLCVDHQDENQPAAECQHTVSDGGHRVSRCQPGACGDRGLGRAAKRAYGAGCFKDHRHLG